MAGVVIHVVFLLPLRRHLIWRVGLRGRVRRSNEQLV